MKKILPLLLCVAVIFSCFMACSKSGGKDNTTTTGIVSTTSGITTDKAKIKNNDAIALIESYPVTDLALTDEERNRCTFMVSSYGEELDGDYYIKVIAAIKVLHEGENGAKDTYTFDTKGEYYISYDGQKILRKNMKTNQIAEMPLREVPTSKSSK